LPDPGGDDELDVLACLQIRSKSENSGAPVGEKLQHFYRVAEVEVEDLVGGENVHLGEGSGFKQVVDGRAQRAQAAGQLDRADGDISLAEGCGSSFSNALISLAVITTDVISSGR
jgi:hypothetical protein